MARHPIPDEAQATWMRKNGVSPEKFFVIHDGGDYLLLQNYETGDEVVIRRNILKKKGEAR